MEVIYGGSFILLRGEATTMYAVLKRVRTFTGSATASAQEQAAAGTVTRSLSRSIQRGAIRPWAAMVRAPTRRFEFILSNRLLGTEKKSSFVALIGSFRLVPPFKRLSA